MTGYILEKLEDAFVTYFSGSALSASGINFYKGIDFLDKESPVLIAFADGATEDFPYSGVYHVNMQIVYKHSFDDTGSLNTRNDNLATLSTTLLGNNNIINELTASASSSIDIYAMQFGSQTNTIVNDAWINQFTIEVVAVEK